MSSTSLLIIVAAIFVAVGWSLFNDWKVKRLALKKAKLEDELQQLCADVSTYSTLRLTSEHIPQKFPSKQDAIAFGEMWSRGGKEGFKAKSIDAQGYDEDHPSFNSATASGGILYTYPALFFGMAEPYKDDEQWFIEFSEAQNKWLRDYLAHLKASSAP